MTEKEARDRGFTAGFAVACSILARDHNQDDLAEFLMRGACITVHQMERAAVDPADIELLKPLIK